MHLPKFLYLRTTSKQEAITLLKDYGPQVRLVSGGTDLFPRMKYGLVHPEVIVSIKGMPAQGPTVTKGGDMHLDPLMILDDVVRSPVVRERAPLLAEAALSVGSAEIRNMGTLGGNLCQETRCTYYNQSHTFQFVEPCFKRGGERCYSLPKGRHCVAVFMADTAPALICLDSEIKIMGPENQRQIPLAHLYSGDAGRPLTLAPDEILTEIVIPHTPYRRGQAYAKFSGRGGFEFGAVIVAVVLDMEDDKKTCVRARIVTGAISASPVRGTKAESVLAGRRISGNLLSEVAQILAEEVSPVPHHNYSRAYLRECLKVQTRRALSAAWDRVKTE